MTRFKKALDNKTHKAFIDASLQEGQSIGVGGTPSVYVNNAKANFKGWSFDKIKAYIDPILIKKGYKKSQLPSKPGATPKKVLAPKVRASAPKVRASAPNPWMSSFPKKKSPPKKR